MTNDETTGPSPIAWYYELAGYLDENGKYILFNRCLSFNRPDVPEDSIRNLTPLYSKDQLNAKPERPSE